MKFGYFDDNAKEYVITSPKTPLPWINYLGCEDFFSLVSNTCGGYSFYKDAKLLRLTRYRYNNVPGDSNGHYYYIKEGNTIWNPGWMPTKTDLDSYECHHGIGYSIFKGSKNDLAAELTDFVPIGSTCEINKLTMTNHSKEEKHFSIFSYVEFCLWNAMDDMTNFQRNYSTGEVEIHGSAIYHKTEYRERRNHYAVYAVNAPIAGFDTSRDAFLGAYGENSAPEVVVSGSCKNSVASGWAPVGSHQLDVTLAPGESRTYVFVLGVYYKLQTFLYLTANGLVQGMRPLIGYNYGAREYKRVKKIYTVVLSLSAVIMLVGTVICLAIPDRLIGLFTTNADTIACGATALRIISGGFVVSAVSVTSSGALEGLNKGVPSLIISLMRYMIVIVPAAFLLSRVFGATGVWHAFWIAELITAVCAFFIYKRSVKVKTA